MEVTLGWLIDRAAQKYPDQEALVAGERRITYAQLANRADRLANGLLGAGVQKGDKVALLLYNGHEFIEAVFGTAKAGGICVPLNYRLKAAELIDILDHCGAVVILYDTEFNPVIEAVKPYLPRLKKYIPVGAEATRNGATFEDLIAGAPAGDPGISVGERDTASLMYTAGTTGVPKGVVCSHANHVWSCINSSLRGYYQKERSVITVIPVFHIAGLQRCLITVFLAGKNVLVKHFEPRGFLQLIETEKPTATILVPTMFTMLTRLPDVAGYDTSSVNCYMIGAAPSSPRLLNQIRTVFPNADVIHIYGLTECTATASYLEPEDFHRKIGSVGKGFLNTEIRVVDGNGDDASPGEIGEILVRGPNVTAGYYSDPEATAAAFLSGNWLKTGDLGKLDEEGYLYIVDRKKDMIISGGENVYCLEVENVLLGHPGVAEAAVIGVPDELWGETVRAIVVSRPGVLITGEQLIDFCAERLAAFKKPRSVVFVAALPRSGANKVLKQELREKYGRAGSP